MRLALLGDVGLFGIYSINIDPNVIDFIRDISVYLSNFDYVVGNMETPFSLEKKTNGAKSAYLCSDIQNVEILKHLGINAVSLANNHMFDYGHEGYETTKKVLTEAGIDFFGAEGKELYVEFEDNRLAFSGFCCYSTNPLQCVNCGEYGVNAYDIEKVKGVIERNHRNGFMNIVSVHAGIEHVNYPSIDHIRAARLLAGICPYIYYGHHPHVVQGVEVYKNSLIAHSLGNFCFDDVYNGISNTPLVSLSENNRTGMILELTIEQNKVVDWKEQLIYIREDGMIKLIENEEALLDYNSHLENCEINVDEYVLLRERFLGKRIADRKKQRNLKWYLSRLRPRYVRLLWDIHQNAKLYIKSVKAQIS